MTIESCTINLRGKMIAARATNATNATRTITNGNSDTIAVSGVHSLHSLSMVVIPLFVRDFKSIHFIGEKGKVLLFVPF